MTKFIYGLCLVMPLVVLLGCEKKESPYAASCDVVLETLDAYVHNMETNKFTKNLYTQNKKDRYRKERVEFLKYLDTGTKEDQAIECDRFLEKVKAAQQTLNNIISEDQALREIPFLKN